MSAVTLLLRPCASSGSDGWRVYEKVVTPHSHATSLSLPAIPSLEGASQFDNQSASIKVETRKIVDGDRCVLCRCLLPLFRAQLLNGSISVQTSTASSPPCSSSPFDVSLYDESLLHELLILHFCRSEHIIHLHSAVFPSVGEQQLIHLQLEHMSDGSLRDWISVNRVCGDGGLIPPLAVDQCRHLVNIFRQLVLALEYLHEQFEVSSPDGSVGLCVIHRDIKPENVCLHRGDQVKLIDFGYATCCYSKDERALEMLRSCASNGDDEDDSYAGGSFLGLSNAQRNDVGTLEYMSPESILGIGYSHTTDYWSVGVTLFECIYGLTPFSSSSLAATRDNIVGTTFHFPVLPANDINPSALQFYRHANEFIGALLTFPPKLRLGANGAKQLLTHQLFSPSGNV